MKDLDKMAQGPKFDFHASRTDLLTLWKQKRAVLLERDFFQKLQEYDIRNIKPGQVAMIKRMYQDDPYMNFEIIKKESALCANLFAWSNEILEYKENAAMRSKIGIKELDEKIFSLEK